MHFHVWERAALQHGRGGDSESLGVVAGDGLAVDFDAFFLRADDPVFLHAGFGVDEGFDAVEFEGGDGDFDDEFGGGGVGAAEVSLLATHDGEVRLRLGINECQGRSAAEQTTRGKLSFEKLAEFVSDAAMQRCLPFLALDRAAHEFHGQLRQAVVILDREPATRRRMAGISRRVFMGREIITAAGVRKPGEAGNITCSYPGQQHPYCRCRPTGAGEVERGLKPLSGDGRPAPLRRRATGSERAVTRQVERELF